MHIYRLPFNAQRRNFRFLAHTLILLALALLFSVGAQAQSESGSAALEGTITDPNAQPLPGAIITSRQQETGSSPPSRNPVCYSTSRSTRMATSIARASLWRFREAKPW